MSGDGTRGVAAYRVRGITSTSALILFEVVWLGADGHPIGRKAVRKRDLTAAANYAARKILYPSDRDSARAHGFYVRSVR